MILNSHKILILIDRKNQRGTERHRECGWYMPLGRNGKCCVKLTRTHTNMKHSCGASHDFLTSAFNANERKRCISLVCISHTYLDSNKHIFNGLLFSYIVTAHNSNKNGNKESQTTQTQTQIFSRHDISKQNKTRKRKRNHKITDRISNSNRTTTSYEIYLCGSLSKSSSFGSNAPRVFSPLKIDK